MTEGRVLAFPMLARFPTIDVEVFSPDPLARLGLVATLGDLDQFDIVAVDDVDRTGDGATGRPGRPRVRLWDGDPLPRFDGETPVVALVDGLEMASRATNAGAAGVLMRDGNAPRMVAALRAAAMGLDVRDRALREPAVPATPTLPVRVDLSPREREVLDLLARGLSNRRIARRLAISEHTAKFHVNRVMEKLDARTRTDAAVRGMRAGLVAF